MTDTTVWLVDPSTGDARPSTFSVEELDRDTELFGRQDWAGLARHRRRLARHHRSAEAWASLGQAFLYVRKPKRAFQALRHAYDLDPTVPGLVPDLLQALGALRKPIDRFPWVTPPRIGRLADGVELSVRRLGERNEPLDVSDLWQDLSDEHDRLDYDQSDLFDALLADSRIFVEFPEEGAWTFVELAEWPRPGEGEEDREE